MPYYKKREYILNSIKSVIKQTYKKFELIIIYDDEDDADLDYVKNLKKLDKRIKLIKNKFNLGAGESRNNGIKISKGKYVSFIDSDDIWKKKKLYKQIKFMKKNNYKISHTSYEIIDEKNHRIGLRKAKNLDIKDLIKSCDIGLSTVMLKKKLISKSTKFPSQKTKEDYVLWLKIASKGNKIYGLNENLVKWRKVKNSLSHSTLRKLIDGYNVYRKHLGYSVIASFYHLFLLSINYIKKIIIN